MKFHLTALAYLLLQSTAAFAPRYYSSNKQRSLSLFAESSPKPLASEGEWSAYLDEETTGLVYYFNGRTGESLWEPPTESFPSVYLKPSRRRRANRKREEYLKNMNEEKTDTNKNFLAALLERELAKEQTEQEEQPEWIDTAVKEQAKETGIWFPSSNKKQQSASEEEEVKKEEPREEGRNWFGDLFFGGPVNGDGPTAEDSSSGGTTTEEKAVVEATEDKKSGLMSSLFAATAVAPAETTPVQKEDEEEMKIIAPEEEPKTINIESSAFILPHPEKVRWGGEDAVFTKGRSFGVFDGVSGADKLDGIPLYSTTLAREMQKAVGNEGLTLVELTKLLADAAEFADKSATGASTAIVASISEDGFLRVLNVGDSKCIVIRNGKVVAKTRDIVHFFECPYQLSDDSPDRPQNGTRLNIELLAGDIIVMASDGVFDNLDPEQVLGIVNQGPPKVSDLAKRIADVSRTVSRDRDAATPYAVQASQYGDPDYAKGLGGKVDDISCVVVRYN